MIFFLSQFYIQFIQIGGMAKQKKKSTNSKAPLLQKSEKQTQLSFQAPLAPVTEPLAGQKRKIADLSHLIKKEESVSPPTVEKKYFLQQFLRQKTISIQVLALQCPNFQAAINQIFITTGIPKYLIFSTIQSYLQGSKHQLWSDKYFPRNLKECLHSNVGQQIIKWIRIYRNFRNCCPQESNSLFDYFGDGNSNTELKCIRQCGWKLKGLILKGRQGVGKSTIIKTCAKQIECQILVCGNEFNQIKYLREKNEATQSECLNTKINKNQVQIQKSNKTLTSFATRNDDAQNQTQSKRIQFMHNANNFYPREEETKFFNQLNKTIQSSKIPFIMSLTGEQIPQALKIYDIIQFEEASSQEISRLLFLIYHIEKTFGQCLDLQKIVEKQKFKEELNEQFKIFQFKIQSSIEDFYEISEISNKKLDFLFTFIQNSYRLSQSPSIIDVQNFMRGYLRRATEDNLMNDYFYSSKNHNTAKEEDESRQQLIDPKYLIQLQINNDEKQKSLIVESTSSNSKKPIKAKTQEKNINSFFPQDLRRKESISLAQMTRQLDIKVIQDYRSQVEENECFIFSKLYDESRQQYEETIQQNIQIKRHVAIRKKIIQNIKRQFYTQNELVTSLKDKELNYVGFLIDSRSRVSRKKVIKQDLNLKKLLKNNEINYVKQFTQILKPNILQQKF